MRITNNMMTRNYMGHMNNNLKNLTKSNDKLSSQRAFTTGSENVSGANRALRVRGLLNDNERQVNNIEDMRGRYNAAEDAMRAINTIVGNVSDKLLQSSSETISQEDRQQISKEIQNLQDQVFQLSNKDYAGKHIFGASGNKTADQPFSLDANGKLMFNNSDVDSMVVGADGKHYAADGVTEVPYHKHSFVDIGVGIKIDANGNVDPRTAMQSTFSGLEVFGVGINADGMPNNLHSLLGKISSDLMTGDPDILTKNLAHLKTRQNALLTNITDVGNRSAYIEQSAERIQNDIINLQTVQNDIESVPLSEEMMHNKNYEMAWMVTLQLGSKIIPPSIFDFIR